MWFLTGLFVGGLSMAIIVCALCISRTNDDIDFDINYHQ